MTGDEKRRSERVIPCVSDEDMVVIDGKVFAKMMDLSESGTLVYLIEENDLPVAVGSSCALSIYHQGNVFDVLATVMRKTGRLIACQFANVPPDSFHEIQSKLIRMEVDWMRLSRRG